jgi:hypothetical protein
MEWPIIKCQHCGLEDYPEVEILESGVHYAKASCQACGRFLKFIPKPDSDPTKYRRPSASRNLVRKHGDRMRRHFGDSIPVELGNVFHGEDGPDDPMNLWILCTGCHHLMHWRRTYLCKPR